MICLIVFGIRLLYTFFMGNKLSTFSLKVSDYFVKFSLKWFLNGFEILEISNDSNNPDKATVGRQIEYSFPVKDEFVVLLFVSNF